MREGEQDRVEERKVEKGGIKVVEVQTDWATVNRRTRQRSQQERDERSVKSSRSESSKGSRSSSRWITQRRAS